MLKNSNILLPQKFHYNKLILSIVDILKYELPTGLKTGDEYPFEVHCIVEEVSIELDIMTVQTAWQEMINIRHELGWYMPSMFYEITVDSTLAYWGGPHEINQWKFDRSLWNQLTLTCESFLQEYNHPKNLKSIPGSKYEDTLLSEFLTFTKEKPGSEQDSITKTVLRICELSNNNHIILQNIYEATKDLILAMQYILEDYISRPEVKLTDELPRGTLVVYYMLIFECVQFVEAQYRVRLNLSDSVVISENSSLRQSLVVAQSHALDRVKHARHLY